MREANAHLQHAERASRVPGCDLQVKLKAKRFMRGEINMGYEKYLRPELPTSAGGQWKEGKKMVPCELSPLAQMELHLRTSAHHSNAAVCVCEYPPFS